MYLVDELIRVGLKEVTGGFNESVEETVKVPSRDELNKYFRGCGDENFAKSGYDPSVSWCGIFATWCLRQAGANVRWVMGKGIRDLSGGNDILFVPGKEGITRGDIAVRGSGNHHFVVLDRTPPATGFFRCVEGNAGGEAYPQMRAGLNKRNFPAGVSYYYRVY